MGNGPGQALWQSRMLHAFRDQDHKGALPPTDVCIRVPIVMHKARPLLPTPQDTAGIVEKGDLVARVREAAARGPARTAG
jgi:hypothetical protein